MDNYILIGFMGSGKSTISKKLSYRMKMVMIDTDKVIEEKEGRTISDIFAKDGEETFRRMETELLEELVKSTHKTILSVGGGTPLREENRTLLKQLGQVIYLEISADTVLERLKGDQTRPLLQGSDARQKVESLLNARKPIYEAAAQITVRVDGKSSDEVVEEVLASL